jgi:hypothetical protein
MDLATRLAGDDEMSSEEREILDQVIETGPAIERLRAIVPGGWRAVPRPVRRALERDDWTRALQEANAAYAAAPGEGCWRRRRASSARPPLRTRATWASRSSRSMC